MVAMLLMRPLRCCRLSRALYVWAISLWYSSSTSCAYTNRVYGAISPICVSERWFKQYCLRIQYNDYHESLHTSGGEGAAT
ncbi:uncharacterized protein C8Q71DRAFT_787257 [Rhodofomes roseus]|uniref:Secreted protein n=1 Tax=Rhodofomes roseus TaxID=34475 RepID=A0ABQ8K1H1_9APHY|nr:uncharacterized protein C8Q71DRAFT_787257 [Rhodofomes roseus]KAH9830099.1 hypothetical protein C8Q71DRAFT_787257 [Rhodofomes roseus]